MNINVNITYEHIARAINVLVGEGMDKDEAYNVLQAIGYTLLDTELFPEDDEAFDESESDYFEVVEVCPHCGEENIYPMWNTEDSGFVAVCKHCGAEIMLCDECQHTVLVDGEIHNCDWCKTECGGKCHRGTTHDNQYTREQLLDVMSGYLRMIKRDNSEFPVIILDDIAKSIEYVLEKNCYNN